MSNIYDIDTLVVSGVLDAQTIDQTNNIRPDQILDQSYSWRDQITKFDFIDGGNDGYLKDSETVGAGGNLGYGGDNSTNTYAQDDRVIVNGETLYVQSMWSADITVTYKDGTTETFLGSDDSTDGVRLFTLGHAGPPNVLTGDVMVNPTDVLRAAINAHPGGVESFMITRIYDDPVDGSLNYTTISKEDDPFICFTRGVLIETERGPVAVEDLRAGDMVLTRDNGMKPVLWTGSRQVTGLAETAKAHIRPVRITAGALGQGVPATDLLVSPQHRILVRSKIALRMFGAMEVLVAAKQLLAVEGIEIADDLSEVEYFHFMFDQHEVVISNGADTESLYTGPEALKAVGPEARAELFRLFPDLFAGQDDLPAAARFLVPGAKGRKLADCHVRNQKDLIS